jgi:hypothetical protein
LAWGKVSEVEQSLALIKRKAGIHLAFREAVLAGKIPQAWLIHRTRIVWRGGKNGTLEVFE